MINPKAYWRLEKFGAYLRGIETRVRGRSYVNASQRLEPTYEGLKQSERPTADPCTGVWSLPTRD
mgnify:CR=1 FL=1